MSGLPENPYLNVIEVRVIGFKCSESSEVTKFESVTKVSKVMMAGDTLNVSFNVTDEGIELEQKS